MTAPRQTPVLQPTHPLRVLLVEGDRTTRHRWMRFLRRQCGERLAITQAAGTAEARWAARRGSFEAAVIAEHLPDGQGTTLVEQFARDRPQMATILVVEEVGRAGTTEIAEAVESELVARSGLDEATLGQALSHALRQARRHGEQTRRAGQTRQALEEMDHLVRALSHDMSAHFMLLEHSVARLTRSLADDRRPELQTQVAHVAACMDESKRFLNDLVDLARTGRVDMDPETVDVEAVVAEVLFEQRELLKRQGVRTQVRGPLPRLWCSRHRLKQVLTNLVRNALKHGCDPRHPRITIEPHRPAPGLQAVPMAGVRVHDNGPGIPPSAHEEVFLPGRRLSRAGAEGSGMGLAIVRKIAEYYGGTVRVDLQQAGGTGMLVVLPLAPPPVERVPKQPAGPPSSDRGDLHLGHDAAHGDPRPLPHHPPSRHTQPHGR